MGEANRTKELSIAILGTSMKLLHQFFTACYTHGSRPANLIGHVTAWMLADMNTHPQGKANDTLLPLAMLWQLRTLLAL